jgi:hypothetical protein
LGDGSRFGAAVARSPFGEPPRKGEQEYGTADKRAEQTEDIQEKAQVFAARKPAYERHTTTYSRNA